MRLLPFKPIVFVPPNTRLKFASHYRFAIIETVVLAIATVILLATLGLNLGIDFKGGTLMEVRHPTTAADIGAMRDKIGGLGLGEFQIQQFGTPNDAMIRLAVQPGGEPAQQAAVAKVRDALGQGYEVRRVEVVGGVVSDELLTNSLIALGLAFAGIFLYVWLRFEWQFASAALIALGHDLAVALCALSISQIDIDLTIVAALLTLIGYAVNDTVVMFDRVRENLRKYKRMPLAELIDLSINETLSRTFMTAGSVLITLIALFVFGSEVIHGFIFTLLVGSAASLYTSLYVAAPLLYAFGVKRDWSGVPGARPAGAPASASGAPPAERTLPAQPDDTATPAPKGPSPAEVRRARRAAARGKPSGQGVR